MGKFMETESRLVVARAGEEETQRVIANGYRISSLGDKNILKLDASDNRMILWMH